MPRLSRTLTVPAVVLVLGLAAVASIVGLQHRAASDRNAQLQLATLRADLTQLQSAPLQSSAATGGSPALGRGLMKTGKLKVGRTLAQLKSDSPVAALDGIAEPLRADYAALEAIFDLGSSGATASVAAVRAAHLIGVAARATDRVEAALSLASGQYERRASDSATRATTGSAVTILMLVLAFGALHGRTVRARSLAERLAQDNARLAALNGAEARTDELTGLRNRRALIDDLETELLLTGDAHSFVLGLFDLDGFKGYNDMFGHQAGDELLARLGHRLTTALGDAGRAYRMGGDEFCILTPDTAGNASAVLRSAEALSEAGLGFDIGCSYGVAFVGDEASSGSEALRLADQRMYAHKARLSSTSAGSASRQSSDVLLKVLSERDADLHHHASGVAELAESTAERLGLTNSELEQIGVAAALHDIGKTAIPDAILNKTGPLDDDEWQFMRRHSVIGERIVRAASSLAPAAGLVRSSHERYDGTGYPDGLSGEDIPIGASIISVCDAFDAMTSTRPYRAAQPMSEAIAELRRCAGAQFHPAVVEEFCALIAEREAVREAVREAA